MDQLMLQRNTTAARRAAVIRQHARRPHVGGEVCHIRVMSTVLYFQCTILRQVVVVMRAGR
jgi:hypothetical protein